MASSNLFGWPRPGGTWPLAFLVAVVPSAGARHAARPAPAVAVAALRTEFQADPLGIDVTRPRLSWQLRSGRRDVVQTAYELQVSTESAALTRGRSPLWDTGRVASDSSVQVGYAGPALRSQTRYYWRVRVWDRDGRASSWSAPAWWETGLLQPSEWQARWIATTWPEVDSISNPSPLLRREFTVRGPVRAARLYVTSHGLYEAYVDGKRVGDAVLTPGWTSYNHRLQYQTYDVTSLVHPGANAIGAMLGDGWYRGRIGFSNERNVYGHKLGLLAQLRIDYADGTHDIVGTDGSWKATPGPIRAANIYDGEDYDARLAPDGWSTAGFDDHAWQPVRVADAADDHLVAPVSPPGRRMAVVQPSGILHTPDGHIVFDMGQNMVGWVRLRVKGPTGTTVTLRHAEMLDQKGNLYTENLRSAKQTDHYTLRGGGEELFEPRFTFHGFRYVQVEGYPGTPTLADLTGIVVHSALDQTGHFETSNPLLNQLQHNITWGQWGNFVDVPTDCPQRDERLGWTGDAQVFSPTAAFNMDVAGFFTKWLRDMAADQDTSGAVPFVIPNVLGRTPGAAGWSDAAVIIPWNMYLAYGDRRLLEEQYPSMKAWVDHVDRRAGTDHIWKRDFQFGDWLAYATTASDYPGATTGKDLVATAYFAHAADLLSRIAAVLGRTADEQHYRELSSATRAAFQREFITSTGRVGENTQTAYVLALSFGLVPDSLRAGAAQRLAEDVRSHGNHLTTGFLGTPELTEELARFGHLDVAYALLNQDTYPSWLYPVKHGATTIWERWDGVKPDGSFQDPGMNSFNHYAYGAIGDWMYRTVAGLDLDPAHPGYKHATIHPQPGGGLTHAAATLATQYGTLASSWKLAGGRMSLDVEVPGNTTATVRLPGATLASVSESGAALGSAGGVHDARQDAGVVVAEVGSGSFHFSWPYAAPATASRTASAATGARVPDRASSSPSTTR